MILIKKQQIQNLIFCLTVLCIAWGLKYHYSAAHADNLKWILTPTTILLETITGYLFNFETGTGYINHDLKIIIAPACAGVNFLIAAFCMGGFCGIFKIPGFQNKWLWLAGCAAAAYILTISVNAFRIGISIAAISADIHAGWFTPQRVHRISGILIYFFFLSAFYHIVQKIILHILAGDPKQGCPQKKQKSRVGFSAQIGIFPLACYWIIAIGIPLINMAHRKNPAGFAEHSLTVGLLSSAVFGFFLTVRIMKRKISA